MSSQAAGAHISINSPEAESLQQLKEQYNNQMESEEEDDEAESDDFGSSERMRKLKQIIDKKLRRIREKMLETELDFVSKKVTERVVVTALGVR